MKPQVMNTVPKEEAINEAGKTNYTHVAALGELMDNALQAVYGNAGTKKVHVHIDLDNKEMTVLDNGRGCLQAEAFCTIGSRRNVRREDDPNGEAHVSEFQDYFEGRISRYGVGGYFGQNKLGGEYHIQSKEADHNIVMRVEQKKNSGYTATFCLEPASALTSAIQSPSEERCEGLHSGTEIKIFELVDDFTKVVAKTWNQKLLCKNLKAIYFNYIDALPEGQQGPGYQRFQQTMKNCITGGVLGDGTSKNRGRRPQELEYIKPRKNGLLKALTDADVSSQQCARSTDMRVTFRSDGAETKFRLGEVRCFIDDICEKAKDCFPLFHSEDSMVVMGGVFYFPYRDGSETCPVHDEFLEQTNSQNLLVFWEGRLLPSASDTLQPKFLKDSGRNKVPDRVRKRCFTVIFLDSRFQPDYNKRHLAQTGLLNMWFKDSKLTDAYEWWLDRVHCKHDQETMFGRSLSGDEEKGEWKPEEEYTIYTQIIQHDKEFKQGDLIQIVKKNAANARSEAMGRISSFRQTGSKAAGRLLAYDGHVSIHRYAGGSKYESETKSFPLSQYILQVLDPDSEEFNSERRRIDAGIVTTARINLTSTSMPLRRSGDANIFFAGQEIHLEIDCLNCENVIVANHGCSFLMFISDQDLPDSEPRRLQGTTIGTAWKHTITKCGRHLLSFKPEHSSNNAIKLVDSENNEISERGIKVFVEAGPADHLVFKTPALEAQLGVTIPAFEIDVLDKFGNPVPKEDVSTILWQFLSGEDCDLHEDYKIVPGDGHVSVSQLRVSKASLPESVSEKKTF